MPCAVPRYLSDCTDAERMLWMPYHCPEAHTGKPHVDLGTREESEQAVELSVVLRGGPGRHAVTTDKPAVIRRPPGLCLKQSSLYLFQELSGWNLQTERLYAWLQPALQISISCRHISSSEQPTFMPRRQLKLTSVFHVQDQWRWGLEGQREGPCCQWLVGFFLLFRWPGYELLWRAHWHILNIMKTPLKESIKGTHVCFPPDRTGVTTSRIWPHRLFRGTDAGGCASNCALFIYNFVTN